MSPQMGPSPFEPVRECSFSKDNLSHNGGSKSKRGNGSTSGSTDWTTKSNGNCFGNDRAGESLDELEINGVTSEANGRYKWILTKYDMERDNRLA